MKTLNELKQQESRYKVLKTKNLVLTEGIIKKYYVKNSSWFDTHPYNIQAISTALKNADAKNVIAKSLVSNQPEVVVFQASPDQIDTFTDALVQIGIKYPIIHDVLPGRNKNY